MAKTALVLHVCHSSAGPYYLGYEPGDEPQELLLEGTYDRLFLLPGECILFVARCIVRRAVSGSCYLVGGLALVPFCLGITPFLTF